MSPPRQTVTPVPSPHSHSPSSGCLGRSCSHTPPSQENGEATRGRKAGGGGASGMHDGPTQRTPPSLPQQTDSGPSRVHKVSVDEALAAWLAAVGRRSARPQPASTRTKPTDQRRAATSAFLPEACVKLSTFAREAAPSVAAPPGPRGRDESLAGGDDACAVALGLGAVHAADLAAEALLFAAVLVVDGGEAGE